MKRFLLMIAVVALVGCGEKDLPEPQAKTPETPKTDVNETTAPKIQPKVGAKNPQTPKATSAKLIADPIVEKAIRKEMMGPPVFKKVTGELTEADLAKVTSLWLNNTKITDEGLKELPKLKNLTYTLNLSFTQITDASIKELAKLKNLKNLTLMNTQITDTGAAELKKAMPNCIILHFTVD
jgi:Leucine-rich repeat (LRR) protein